MKGPFSFTLVVLNFIMNILLFTRKKLQKENAVTETFSHMPFFTFLKFFRYLNIKENVRMPFIP